MTHLYYPIERCHFCDSIIIYQRYEDCDYASCNSSNHCMSFRYSKKEGYINIQSFAMDCWGDVFYLRSEQEDIALCYMRYMWDFQKFPELQSYTLQDLLDKNKCLQLSDIVKTKILPKITISQ